MSVLIAAKLYYNTTDPSIHVCVDSSQTVLEHHRPFHSYLCTRGSLKVLWTYVHVCSVLNMYMYMYAWLANGLCTCTCVCRTALPCMCICTLYGKQPLTHCRSNGSSWSLYESSNGDHYNQYQYYHTRGFRGMIWPYHPSEPWGRDDNMIISPCSYHGNKDKWDIW